MSKIRIEFGLNNEQKKSSAKICHDTAKALVAAALIDGFLKNSFARPLGTFSIAILCFAAGLSIEKTIEERGSRNE